MFSQKTLEAYLPSFLFTKTTPDIETHKIYEKAKKAGWQTPDGKQYLKEAIDGVGPYAALAALRICEIPTYGRLSLFGGSLASYLELEDQCDLMRTAIAKNELIGIYGMAIVNGFASLHPKIQLSANIKADAEERFLENYTKFFKMLDENESPRSMVILLEDENVHSFDSEFSILQKLKEKIAPKYKVKAKEEVTEPTVDYSKMPFGM